MGCAECKLLKSLKFHRHIESLIGVDIDSSLLESHHHSLQPLVTDYLQRRPRPLKIQLFKGQLGFTLFQIRDKKLWNVVNFLIIFLFILGSIDEADCRLSECDLFSCIEVLVCSI